MGMMRTAAIVFRCMSVPPASVVMETGKHSLVAQSAKSGMTVSVQLGCRPRNHQSPTGSRLRGPIAGIRRLPDGLVQQHDSACCDQKTPQPEADDGRVSVANSAEHECHGAYAGQHRMTPA